MESKDKWPIFMRRQCFVESGNEMGYVMLPAPSDTIEYQHRESILLPPHLSLCLYYRRENALLSLFLYQLRERHLPKSPHQHRDWPLNPTSAQRVTPALYHHRASSPSPIPAQRAHSLTSYPSRESTEPSGLNSFLYNVPNSVCQWQGYITLQHGDIKIYSCHTHLYTPLNSLYFHKNH